ncbi:MAG: hypothetical protein J6U35_02115 [Clostridia bacterium]|nr:hypothetical protein [Clostridia bacterium]
MRKFLKGLCIIALAVVTAATVFACESNAGKELANKSAYNGIKTVVYGSYAQDVVTSPTLIAELEAARWVNDRAIIGLNEYERVVAAPYRSGASFGDGTEIEEGKTYYFAVSPINWYVLSSSSGKSVVTAEKILDVQAFNTNTETDNDGNYPNNWGMSTLRDWLNGAFYDKAFSEFDKVAIDTAKVISAYPQSFYKAHSKAIADTWDKVYALSYAEMTDTAYKFSEEKGDYDMLRVAKVSDYARAKGAWFYIASPDEDSADFERETFFCGAGVYWLRTVGKDISFAGVVRYNGTLGISDNYVNDLKIGVRPSMTLGFEA